MTEQPFRVLPRLDDNNTFFWTSGQDGKLRFLRCQDDGTYVHPPSPVCPVCLGRKLEPEAVSGRATVATFTINHQPWYPGLDPPYVIAIVEIAEQPSVRLMTNIIGCPPDEVRIGMAVRVVFEEYAGDTWIPFFEPAEG